MRFSRVLPVGLAIVLLVSGAIWAQAGESAKPLSVEPLSKAEKEKLPQPSAKTPATDKIIRLTPNKTKVLKLNRDAGSVIVSNPRHASVMIDSPRVLIIVPRAPGATALTILDNDGELIAERDIIVTGQEEHYIRIRKYCASNDPSCAANSIYYCPDNCFAISTESENDASGATADLPETINDNSAPAPTPAADGGKSENEEDLYNEDLNPENTPSEEPVE